MTQDEDWQELPPSKSARKREAHALQKLGEELVRLRAADLARLPLPETLRDAIEEARRLTSRGALSRQHQYIGRLMRDIDVDALEKALALLPDQKALHARIRR